MQFTWTLYWVVFGICILASAGVLLLLAIRELQQGVDQLKNGGCAEDRRRECREALLEAQRIHQTMNAAAGSLQNTISSLETTDQILDRMVAKTTASSPCPGCDNSHCSWRMAPTHIGPKTGPCVNRV